MEIVIKNFENIQTAYWLTDKEKRKIKKLEKNIIKLSQIAEKQQRLKKQADGTYNYYRPQIAGAWEMLGNQYINGEAWAVIYKHITEGTTNNNVDEDTKKSNSIFTESFFPAEEKRGEWFKIDLKTLTENYKNARKIDKNKDYFCNIGDNWFNAKFVKDILATLDNPLCCMAQLPYFHDKKLLYLSGYNGDAIILPCRKIFNPGDFVYEVETWQI